jgi:hypothetical protein
MSAQLQAVGERVQRGSIRIIPFAVEYLQSALEIAWQIHTHSVYADFPMDENKLAQQLLAAGTLQSPDRYFRIAVRGARVLGGFYGCVHRVFFADVLVAKDLGWWVRQEARGGAAAMALLCDFERWAKEQGAVKVGIGQTGVEDIERTGALFRHCGYKFIGYNSMKDL